MKRSKVTKLLIAIVCCLVLISENSTVYASSYSSNWQGWAQTASDYAAMRSYGCRVTAFAKCLAEGGITDFKNPDGLYEWGKANGRFSGDIMENGSFGTLMMKYLDTKKITYQKQTAYDITGNRTSDCAKIMQLLNQGYYCFLACNSHTVYIGRAASLAAGEPIIMDSDGKQKSYKTYSSYTFAKLNYFQIGFGPLPPIRVDKVTLSGLTKTTAKVRADVTADVSQLSTVGIKWGTSSSNLDKTVSFPAPNNYLNYVEVSFDGTEGPTLSSGTTYYYRFFAKLKTGQEYYPEGDMVRSFKTLQDADTEKPSITGARVDDISCDGYTVRCTATDNVGVNYCLFVTWTEASGYDKRVKATVVTPLSDGSYEYRVNTSDHNGEMGSYYTTAYAYDAAGNWINSDNMQVTVQHCIETAPAVPATCTTEGKTEGSYCSKCLAIITQQTIIPAKGHTPMTDAAVPATCTAAGKTEGSHCSVCSEVIVPQTAIPAKGHTPVTDAAVPATCTAAGKTEGSHCSVCSVILTAQRAIPAKGHTYSSQYTIDRKATPAQDGCKSFHCANCGATKGETVIYAASKIKLSKATYTYNGKAQKPSVSVKNSQGKKIGKTNYVIEYVTPTKAIGKHTVKIVFQGEYTGEQILSYKIIPKKTDFSELTPGNRKFVAEWKVVSNATGYEIQYATNSKFVRAKKVTVNGKNMTMTAISGLNASKKYYVRIRAYKKAGGKKYYSKWSSVKTVVTQ